MTMKIACVRCIGASVLGTTDCSLAGVRACVQKALLVMICGINKYRVGGVHGHNNTLVNGMFSKCTTHSANIPSPAPHYTSAHVHLLAGVFAGVCVCVAPVC